MPSPLRGTKPHASGDFEPLSLGPIQRSLLHSTPSLEAAGRRELGVNLIGNLTATRFFKILLDEEELIVPPIANQAVGDPR